MRLYDIQLLKPRTSTIVKRWQSFPNGTFDPGAQNVILDALVTFEDSPLGGSSLKIEGISLADIKQATQYGFHLAGPHNQQLPGMDIRIFGGMGKGLPLANPQQQGLILAGTVYQSFANWQGVEMSLDMVIYPALSYITPPNLTFQWPAGTQLGPALAQTFTNAFPGYKQVINVNPNRILSHTETGAYSSVDRFASFIRRTTVGQLSSNDPGVGIVVQSGSAFAIDGTAQKTPKPISFFDLIGQPTWLDYASLQVKTVMRGDILVGDVIQLAADLTNTPGAVVQTSQGLPGLRQASIFTGNFIVTQIRHLGNFRSGNGADWCSIFNCVASGAASNT